jgi:ElaA protein
MTEASVEVASFSGDDPRLARCLHIRRVVFIDEQDVAEAEEIDGLDGDCQHFLASSATEDLGTARLRMVDGAVAKAERVAVHRHLRGKGIGRCLMEALEVRACQLGARTVKLGAQVSALRFYEGLGYEAYGPEFDDAGIPHRMMQKGLAKATQPR